DDSGTARRSDGRDGKPGFRGMGFRRSGSLGGWAVGAQPRILPMDLAMPLPKGSDIVLQTHFHPAGKAEREKTVVGLHFAKQRPGGALAAPQLPPLFGRFAGIDIPAGEKAFEVGDSFTLPCDVQLINVGGHAHYVCRAMTAVATLPDGSTQRLFKIGDWDFNW